jgi:hypothetical protein
LIKRVRIGLLTLLLVLVAGQTWLDRWRSTRWTEPLFAAIYPIAADDSPVTQRYVAGIDAASFRPIDRFFSAEGARHGLALGEPVKTRLRPSGTSLPPQRSPQDGVLRTIVWSLRLRYWAWMSSGHVREPEDIRLFVLYHDPALTPTVPHSLGLREGLIGVVYAFADPEMSGANDVVIAHELLHTLGATDKYDPNTNAPRFPDGFGNPVQVPLYPQRSAELMGGRRMLAADRWEQPVSLEEVVIGHATAAEIHWPATN